MSRTSHRGRLSSRGFQSQLCSRAKSQRLTRKWLSRTCTTPPVLGSRYNQLSAGSSNSSTSTGSGRTT
ncbi:MAG: hypothetical protein AW07_04028 [Candidatus Accumulibacter sp. SK-11]|nr:MAG: hypothetical protein AW07_04028 [Candidatus Accumulibacter sp. SK-11]